jgi:taurine dioxygenase
MLSAMTVASTAINVTLGIAPLVATVTGIDLSEPLSPVVLSTLHSAWARFPVLVFPRQALDARSLEDFAGRFGPIGIDPFVRPVPGARHVVAVSHGPRETAPVFGSAWHSDWSFLPVPPSGTLLYAVEVPPFGGDTLIADCASAFDALSDPVQRFLLSLHAEHSAVRAYGPQGLFARDDASRSMSIVVSPQAEAIEVHPLVRTHQPSGRRALFINPVYTLRVVGLHEDESRALLEFLFRHMVRDEFVYRHRWEAGTLLLWDNRRVAHRALGGHAGHQRLMYRVTLAGERPAA